MTPPFDVEWMGHNIPAVWPQFSMQRVYLRAHNTRTRTWLAAPAGGGGAGDDEIGGACVDFELRLNGDLSSTVRPPHDVPPGSQATISFPVAVPLVSLTGRGELEVAVGLVAPAGLPPPGPAPRPLVVRVGAGPAEAGPAAEALQFAAVGCSAFYLPSGGVSRGRDGRLYPLVARKAAGCRVSDLEGNQWIDYVMGWGSALLGYARPEISEAIRGELDSGAVLGLPSFRELEVAQFLGEMVPCAEMTLFGKNGSDVCTAAARMARVYTGRPGILFSGYSGWQEPFAQAFEPGLARPGEPPAAFRFPAEDLGRVDELLNEHAGQVAAVMIEPAAQVEGVDGPVRDAAPDFLRAVAGRCRAHGALLIFDEIMTGFRYPTGSVQKATGVVPDLACFGKALSSGMPLSVLVGRREVMKSVTGIFYHPTFRGEAYSFAAAAAALRLYQREDVPAKVGRFGRGLMDAVNQLSRRLGAPGEMVGLPFRMVYRFGEPDVWRRTLMRTLLHQELLKRGVLTFRGFMLPSAAHGDAELELTVAAFEGALGRVREVAAAGDFERHLEIPPIV